MDKAGVVQKASASPGTGTGYQQAVAAIRALEALSKRKDLDKKALYAERKKLIHVVSEYRRKLNVKKAKRKKHTRG
ncbi:hypothetical protein HY251_20600 [bacterium]|nr:hypothetical protein [bacterium]